MKNIKRLIIVSVLIVFCFSRVYASDSQFTDLEKHWAKSTIEKFVVNGIVNGYQDNTFKPDENVTVAEFLKIIVVAGKYDLIREGNAIWPDFYINTALENGLLKDLEILDCDSAITRYQASSIIANFINVTEVSKAKNRFKDLDEKQEDIVLKLVELKVIDGYKDKTFKGENHLTRAEAVTLINRAIDTKTKLINNKEYQIENKKFSNYKTNDFEMDETFFGIEYEISNQKILIYDNGKYAKLEGYAISGDTIKIEKVIKLIKELINEQAYVAVLYQPSNYTINQVQILYGDSREKVECGEVDFSFTFFENKFYELSRISMEEKFSNKVFAKIEVIKLWSDYSEFKAGKTIDSFKKAKLKKALNAICKSDAERICNYIIQKNKEYIKGKMQGIEIKESKVFSSYIVDFYKKENGVPTFYLSER